MQARNENVYNPVLMTQEANRPETTSAVDFKDIVFTDSQSVWKIDGDIRIKLFPKKDSRSLDIWVNPEFPIVWKEKSGLKVHGGWLKPITDVKNIGTSFDPDLYESIQIGDFTITHEGSGPQGESFRIAGLKPDTQIHKESRENNVGHTAK